jgi:thiamine transporter
MNNKKTRFITEIGIFSALGIALDFICGQLFSFAWLNGGSISIAMVPIFLMSYRWGLKGGLTTGVIVGTVQILWANSSYIVGFFQVFLDYIFAYGLVGIAGIFAKKVAHSELEKQIIYIILGSLLGGLLRSVSHIISGVIYFKTPIWGSILYNMAYMGPSIVICILVMITIVNSYPIFLQQE